MILRRNHSDFPAANGRPAFSHDDLTVIYEDQMKQLSAEYYDNEGHVIHYSIQESNDTLSTVFISLPVPNLPRFRLTYTLKTPDSLTMRFEMAQPAKPDVFIKYLEAGAHRK